MMGRALGASVMLLTVAACGSSELETGDVGDGTDVKLGVGTSAMMVMADAPDMVMAMPMPVMAPVRDVRSCGQYARDVAWMRPLCDNSGGNTGVCKGAGVATMDCNLCCDTQKAPPGQTVIPSSPTAQQITFAGGFQTWANQGAGVATNVSNACSYYLEVRDSLVGDKACSPTDRARLEGYYRVCLGSTAMALPLASTQNVTVTGPTPDAKVTLACEGATDCSNNASYQRFHANMRYCLQQRTSNLAATGASCNKLVEGIMGDPTTGVIGAHGPCGVEAGLETMDPDAWGCFLRGFGAGYGRMSIDHIVKPIGEGGLGGTGPQLAVGVCHLISMALQTNATGNFEEVLKKKSLNDICATFKAGCECSNTVKNGVCFCPQLEQGLNTTMTSALIDLLKFARENVGPDPVRTALAFERECTGLLGRTELSQVAPAVAAIKTELQKLQTQAVQVAQAAVLPTDLAVNAVLGDTNAVGGKLPTASQTTVIIVTNLIDPQNGPVANPGYNAGDGRSFASAIWRDTNRNCQWNRDAGANWYDLNQTGWCGRSSPGTDGKCEARCGNANGAADSCYNTCLNELDAKCRASTTEWQCL